MRACKVCKEEKDLRWFYRKSGGRVNTAKCMDCTKKALSLKYRIGKHKLREELNMITINLNEYRLTYFRKSDGRKFLVRPVGAQEYVVWDTVELKKEHFSQYKLRKYFVPDSDNFSRLKDELQLRVC